jgi:hypothetical protein
VRTVRIESLIGYIEFIAGLTERAACFRGAKDPVEDMKPTVVRSWQRNRRIRQDAGWEPRLGLWEYEAQLIETFQRRSLPFLESVPDCHLSWLAVAQHHQLPTRLLDWTRNPLIALYFAATNRGAYRPPEQWEDAHVFVWEVSDGPDAHRHVLSLERTQAMRPVGDGLIGAEGGLEPSEAGVLLFSPPLISARIATQEGLFSFEEQLSEVPFPEAAERAGLALTKLVIPGPARLDILKHLDRLGIESEKLFPDLPGLCAHQRWVAEWLW